MDELRELSGAGEELSSKQLSLLKLIVCHGLYPQLALPDSFNSCRKDSDQVSGIVFFLLKDVCPAKTFFASFGFSGLGLELLSGFYYYLELCCQGTYL